MAQIIKFNYLTGLRPSEAVQSAKLQTGGNNPAGTEGRVRVGLIIIKTSVKRRNITVPFCEQPNLT